jgi:hypothetical protein
MNSLDRAVTIQVCSCVVGGAASALLGACAVGPNFHRPEPPNVKGYQTEPLPVTAARQRHGSSGTVVDAVSFPGA